ncbi:MAG TPA: serine/threonine-protein kinase [Kofleriaceae bacterium]
MLESAPRVAVEEHLATCSACRDLLFALATNSGEARREATASPTKLGRYDVGEPIGSGSMGTVFSGFDPDLKRPVALKVLNTDPNAAAQARLFHEAQALAQLSHPNVVAVYDVGRSDHEVFIAMELLVGRDLERWLAETPRKWKPVVDLFLDVARGLAAAHAAGIVHRDLKPRNIFVETTGRVCVTDFGLARVQADALVGDVRAAGTGSVRSLGTAELVGTPAYMSPEQIDGKPATERSDQYSFCVALHEALTGQRPFVGNTLAELRAAMRTGFVMRTSRAAPTWLGRVLARGLAEDAEQRYASIDQLILSLRSGRTRGRRRIALGGAAAVACAFAITGAVAAQRITAVEPCTGAERHVASVWTEQRATRAREAFTASGLPYAADSWRSVDAAIKQYSQRWIAGWRDACVATSVRKEQSAELLDKRMVCLERKRAEVDAFAVLLGGADRALIAEAPAAIARLSAPESCGDRSLLVDAPAPPAGSSQRVVVTMLSQWIAQARAFWVAGRYAKGLEHLMHVETQVESAGHLPTLASFLSLKGLLEDETGAFDPAEATWRRNIQVAAEAGDRILVARTWLDLIRLLGVRKGDSEKALALVPAAQSAVTLSRDPELAVRFHAYLGTIHRNADQLPEAEKELRQALAGYQRKARGKDDLDVATASTNLGLAINGLGKLAEAEKLHRSALATFTTVYGPNHPRTAAVHNNLGMVLQGMEKYEESRVQFKTAVDVLSAALGPEHQSLAGLLSNLALAEGGVGRREDAVKTHRRAVAILERKLPPGDPKIATARGNLALELAGLGQNEEARRLLESAVADTEARFGPKDRRTALHLSMLADVLVELDACNQARGMYRRVIAIHESFKPVDEHMLALALDGAARCASTDAERIPVLERALAIRLAIEEQPEGLAGTQLALARALRKKELARARKLAADARAGYVAAGDRGKEKVAAIDAEFGGPDRGR